MKKVLFTILCLLILFDIKSVNASECDSEDIDRLKGIASNITYTSDYIGDKDMTVSSQTYNVSFVGITDEVYISDLYHSFSVNSDNDVIQLQSGTNRLEVYSRKCDNKRLKTITIDLLKYNIYSRYEECNDIPDSELYVCDPWYQGKITDSVFYKEIDSYNLKIEEESKTSIDRLIELFYSYYYIIVPVIIFLILLIIIFLVKNIKKNKLD